jgi:hypothetical protein
MSRAALIASFLALVLSGPASAASPYDDLLKHVPSDTNTLVLIDVKGALNSQLAKVEQWNEKGQRDNRGGLGFVPADAEVVVIAASINMNSMSRDAQLGLVKVRNVPTMRELANREGGTNDEIAERLAVLSPRNVYFTTLSGSELACIYPADRQYTARWLRSVKAKKTGELSPFLQKVVANSTGNNLTIALDLEDVVDKHIIKMALKTSPVIAKTKDLDLDLLSLLLAGIKGMTFSANVSDSIRGTITIEFVGDPSRYRNTLPDLFRELLQGQGIAMDYLEAWNKKFTDNTLTLSGPMTTMDVRRLLSLFAFPGQLGEPDPMVAGKEPSVGMTKRYIAAVDAILGDIQKLKSSDNYEKTATWHDKAATQIDQLSRQSVDPIATQAAYQVAQRLRATADSLRGVPINAQALENQAYSYVQPSIGAFPGGPFGWSPFVGGQLQTNIPQIQNEIAKVVADDAKRRTEIWSQMERILGEARRKLTDKYKTDF